MSVFDLHPINADGTFEATQGNTLKAIAAIRDSYLPQGRKLVLLMLASRARPTYEQGWVAFPSVSTLAADCSLGQRSVYAALKWLETARLIHVDRGGGRHVNVYEVDMLAVQDLPVREQLRKKRRKRG